MQLFSEFLCQNEGEVFTTLLKQIIFSKEKKKGSLLGVVIMLIKIQDCKFMMFLFPPNLHFTLKVYQNISHQCGYLPLHAIGVSCCYHF